jgi:dynein heavy chain
MIDEFNGREKCFKMEPSTYPMVDELSKEFKPFFDLLHCANNMTDFIKDWTMNPLLKQNYADIASQVNDAQTLCLKLYKTLKINLDYPDAAQAAQD